MTSEVKWSLLNSRSGILAFSQLSSYLARGDVLQSEIIWKAHSRNGFNWEKEMVFS